MQTKVFKGKAVVSGDFTEPLPGTSNLYKCYSSKFFWQASRAICNVDSLVTLLPYSRLGPIGRIESQPAARLQAVFPVEYGTDAHLLS